MAALSEVIDGLNLNSGGYLVASRDYGSPNLAPLTIPRSRRWAVDRLVSTSANGSRVITYTVEMAGATTDATIALYRALLGKLPLTGTAKDLVVKPTNATNAVTFRCLAVDGDLPSPYDLSMDVGHRASVSFMLLCEPYAYGPETTLVNGADLTTPGLIDLGTVPGDFPSPVDIHFAWGAATYVRSFWCGALKGGSALTASNLLVEGEAAPWYGGQNGDLPDDFAHEGFKRYNASWAYASRYFSDNALDRGTYLVLIRAAVENAADFGTLRVGTRDGTVIATASIADSRRTSLHLFEMARMALPNAKVRGAMGSAVCVDMNNSASGSGHGTFVDYVSFVPLSWGFFSIFQPFGTGSDLASAHLSYAGDVYQSDVASVRYTRSAPISAVGPTKLWCVTESDSPGPTSPTTVTAKVIPRYALWA